MRIALFATNQFLLLTAVNLKCTLLASDEVHLYTTFQFENILFEKVFYIKDIGVIEETTLDLQEQMKSAYFGDENFLEISKDIIDVFGELPQNYNYDKVIAMGYTYFPFWLTANNRKRGNNTILSRLCDGVVFKYSPLNYHFNRYFNSLLCTTPSYLKSGFDEEFLYNMKLCPPKSHKVIEIPQISSDKNIVFDALDKLVGYSDNSSRVNKFDYIFFTSSTVNGKNAFSNETETIIKVANQIGKNNMIIRPHPWRDTTDLLNLGIEIDTFKWCSEFLYPHIDISNKIFISVGTNAVFTPFEIFNIHSKKVLFLDKMMKINPVFYKNSNFNFSGYTDIQQQMLDQYKNDFTDIYKELCSFTNIR